MSGHKGRKGGHEEEHESHERWLISYADMITLLMVLFVVMFAISNVDQKKFAELSAGLSAGFGAPRFVAMDGAIKRTDRLPAHTLLDLAMGLAC